MPLFPRDLSVRLHPLVYHWDIRLQNRIVLRFQIGQFFLVPIFLVGIFPDSLETQFCPPGNFTQTYPFIFMKIFDILLLSHSYHLSATSFSPQQTKGSCFSGADNGSFSLPSPPLNFS